MNPIVRDLILKAERLSAVDVFQHEYRRQVLSRQIENAFKKFEAILVPTTPTFPTIQMLNDEPVLANSRLGTFTNFVNFMDWSALAIPAGLREDGLPFGITLIAGPWEEQRMFKLGHQLLSDAPRLLGTTSVKHQEDLPVLPFPSNSMPLAVVGAHLSGFPLNKDDVTGRESHKYYEDSAVLSAVRSANRVICSETWSQTSS
jgi:urea carboxylase/allophanate hydrolase